MTEHWPVGPSLHSHCWRPHVQIEHLHGSAAALPAKVGAARVYLLPNLTVLLDRVGPILMVTVNHQ
jgi:hypothetical protein